MPEIFWGPLNPTGLQTNTAVDGDIFISTGNFTQRRKVGAGWVFIVPPEAGQPRTTLSDTRGDVVPSGGELNARLAKIGPRAWELGWANAAEGVVGPPPEGRFDQETPELVWNITHNLSARWIDVTVISPGNTDPDAEQTILMPRVEYAGLMICRLHFVEPVTGTAIIRR